MASVFLLILKIIGIVILSLIGLVLLLAAIILFVPVRYRTDGHKGTDEGDLSANANVSFLLHIISAGFSYDDELCKYIKIFGIKLKKKDKEKPEDDVPKPAIDDTDSDETAESAETEENTTVTEDDFTIDWNDDTESFENTSANESQPEEQIYVDDDSKNDDSLTDRIDSFIESITDKYDELSQKYEDIRKKIRFWDKMIHDDRNRNAAELIKVCVIKLLKRIAPRRIKGQVHFGFEDPATTGKILMYLALIYPVMPKKLKIEPSFTDTDIFGDISVKGRLALIYPLVYFIRIYFNKDFKRMWRLYKKHKDRS